MEHSAGPSRRRGFCLVTVALLSIIGTGAHAQPALLSPWDSARVNETAAPYPCSPQPVIAPDLKTDGFYALDDPTHSRVDPVRLAAYQASSNDVKSVGLAIVEAADAYRTTGSRAAARCALARTDALARNNALGGAMSSAQAYYVQGWVTGAIAIAYLKVRQVGIAPAERKRIARWLQHVGTSTLGFYAAEEARGHGTNNHLYWAGLELAAIGVVANDRADFDWGVAAYKQGVDEIAPDGTLPQEMARGTRAVHYHLYALAPLVLLAEFGESNGLALYSYRAGALERLERFSVAGLRDPAPFVQRTHVAQEIPTHPGGDDLAWAPEYLRRFPDAGLQQLVNEAPTLRSFYLGGLPPPQ